jgi:hypothetical protein
MVQKYLMLLLGGAILLTLQLLNEQRPAQAPTIVPGKIESLQPEALLDSLARSFYTECVLADYQLDYSVFKTSVSGYLKLASESKLGSNAPLAVVDFSLASTQKRLWIIDLYHKKVLFHTLVAHGRNSGENYAHSFSNKAESYQSSLGFYLTGQTYTGKHGLSLLLHGQEAGLNDKARERAIVMHGADYVSDDFIRKTGRLGRSLGCPAIPEHLKEKIINTLKNGACLYIYYPDKQYFSKSAFIKAMPLPAEIMQTFVAGGQNNSTARGNKS